MRVSSTSGVAPGQEAICRGTPLLPGHDALATLQQWQRDRPAAELKTMLGEVMPKRFAQRLCEFWLPNRPMRQFDPPQLREVAAVLADWPLVASGTEGYRTADIARLTVGLDLHHGSTLLDAGCGTGQWAIAFATLGCAVTAQDLAPAMVDRARDHAKDRGVSIEFRTGDVSTLPEPAATFDAIFGRCVLLFVPDPPAVVDALAALVKPGGAVFLSTINRTPRAYVQAVVGAEYVLRLLPAGTHSYEKFIRPSELATWARAAGLSLEDVSGLDYDPFARSARLTSDARVNYVVRLRRPGTAGTG